MSEQRDQFETNNSGTEQMNSNSESVNRGDGSNGRKSNRGFAAMSPERQKQIASEGGRAAHRLGVAHEWSSEEARMAGRKGGQIVSRNREHMSEIGRRGGQSSGGRRANKDQQNGTGREE